MIDPKILDSIGAYAESVGFEYIHNTCRSWVGFVDKESRTVCVDYKDPDTIESYVNFPVGLEIHFLCGEHARPDRARMINKYLPDGIKIMEMLEVALNTKNVS